MCCCSNESLCKHALKTSHTHISSREFNSTFDHFDWQWVDPEVIILSVIVFLVATKATTNYTTKCVRTTNECSSRKWHNYRSAHIAQMKSISVSIIIIASNKIISRANGWNGQVIRSCYSTVAFLTAWRFANDCFDLFPNWKSCQIILHKRICRPTASISANNNGLAVWLSITSIHDSQWNEWKAFLTANCIWHHCQYRWYSTDCLVCHVSNATTKAYQPAM